MSIITEKGISFYNRVIDGVNYKFGNSSKQSDIFFISQFKNPATLQRIIDDIDKALSGNFDQINDPDISNSIDIAFISPFGIDYYDENGQEILYTSALTEFKDQVVAWMKFLESAPLDGESR